MLNKTTFVMFCSTWSDVCSCLDYNTAVPSAD